MRSPIHLVKIYLIVLIAIALEVSFLGATPARGQSPGWSEPVNLSQTDHSSKFPAIAADQAGHVFVIWSENTSDTDSLFGDAIYFTMWDGTLWSKPNDILASELGDVASVPLIAVDSRGLIHVIWGSRVGLYYSHAWVQEAPWQASAWSPRQLLSGGFPVDWAYIAVDSQDRVHIVRAEATANAPEVDEEGICISGCDEIYYINSTDGGETWSSEINISNSRHLSFTPHLAVDGQDNLHVVWTDTKKGFEGLSVLYSHSLDGGKTWSEPLDLGSEINLAPDPIRVAVDQQDRVHVFWPAESGAMVYHRWSSDGGGTWSEADVVLDSGKVSAYRLHPVVDSENNIHLLFNWWPAPGERYTIFSTTWNGQGWSTPARISRNDVWCTAGGLAISEGNRLHAVWFENDFSEEGVSNPYVIGERGNWEIGYSTQIVDSPHISPVPLPELPTPVLPTPTLLPTPTVTPSPPESTTTSTPVATRWSPSAFSAEDAQTGRWVPNPLLVGPALAGVLVVVVVILKSATIGKR